MKKYQEYQQALKNLLNHICGGKTLLNSVIYDCTNTLQELVNKARPLKILQRQDMSNPNIVNYYVGKCPSCNCSISNGESIKYCGCCGQALEWSDERMHD